MKSIILGIAIALFSLCLVACGGSCSQSKDASYVATVRAIYPGDGESSADLILDAHSDCASLEKMEDGSVISSYTSTAHNDPAKDQQAFTAAVTAYCPDQMKKLDFN